jgi:hypothetical protein
VRGRWNITSPIEELNEALADGWVVDMGRATCTKLVTCVGTRLAGCVVLRNKCCSITAVDSVKRWA